MAPSRSKHASTTTSSSLDVKKHHLRGHSSSVTCLDHSHSHHQHNPSFSNKEACPYSSHECLLSGSSDGTARLWDLRMHRAAVCILTEKSRGEVTSVAFHQPGSSSSSSSSVWQSYCVYLATEDHVVLQYDLRRMSPSPCVIVKPEWGVDCTRRYFGGMKDEVNQLSLARWNRSMHGKTEEKQGEEEEIVMVAAADDSGEVRIAKEMPLQNHDKHEQEDSTCDCTILHHGSDQATTAKDDGETSEPSGAQGVAMVTSAVFRPTTTTTPKHSKISKTTTTTQSQPSSLFLASGGTDCTVKLWNIPHPPPTTTSSTSPLLQDQHLIPPTTTSANQVCNPPMVHSLSWSNDGRMLAAALGDGSCQIYTLRHAEATNVANKKTSLAQAQSCCGGEMQMQLEPVVRLEQAHASSMACVCFPTLLRHPPSHLSSPCKNVSHDRLLLTAGNDGNVLLWDIGSDLVGHYASTKKQDATATTKYINPTEFFPPLQTKQHKTPQMQKQQQPQSGKNGQAKKKKKKKQQQPSHHHHQQSKKKDDEEEEEDGVLPRVLWGIPHGHKPNWMIYTQDVQVGTSNTKAGDMIAPSSLYLADTTKDITVYTLPRR